MTWTGRALQDALGRKCYHPSGAFAAFPRSALDIGVPARFEQQVRLYGARPAVRSDAGSLSYAQLNGIANDVAHAVLDAGGAVESFVAVLTDQGAMNVAAPLGVLKAGKAFVPLDTHWPAARMRWVLDHSHADVVLSSAGNASVARDIARPGQRVLVLEDFITATGRDNPCVPIDADAPAYVLYTSGSTGRPKGVRHSHRSLSHEVLRLTNALHVCADDRQSLLRANSGGAISDAFTALLNGAVVCPFDVLGSGLDELADWVRREQITIWRSTPSLFRAVWGGRPSTDVLPHLRIVFVCGEPVHTSDLDAYRAHCGPACLFVNCLGSTECATVTLFLSDRDAAVAPGPVSIGYPVEDMEVHLVDESGDVMTGTATGEIVVRSRYLADGYLDDPALTDKSFRDDPEEAGCRLYFSADIGSRLDDGALVYLGRRDSRANVNGRTFELAEIEAALQAMDGIREAVAAVAVDARGVSHLAAYVVSEGVSAPSSTALRLWLHERLPSFMIPARFVFVDRIPLTTNGKIDRRALPEALHARPALATPFVRPRMPLDVAVARIYAEMLDLDGVGVSDNFFELGGTSLAVMRVLSRITACYGVTITPRAFYDQPTVAETALVVEQELAARADQETLARWLDEIEGSTARASAGPPVATGEFSPLNSLE